MTRAFVLGLARKDRDIAGLVRRVRIELEAAGWQADSAVVDQMSDLRVLAQQAIQDGFEVVAAVGGDGVVNQVIAALAGTKVALGIIPAGTGNLLAGNLGIPRLPNRATQNLISGRRRRIDVGQAALDGKTYDFAVACGIGFDAQVMAATGSRAKRHLGKLAYFISALKVGRHIGNVDHEISLDGITQTGAAQVMVANLGDMAAGLAPRRPILPDDGLLDIIVVRAGNPLMAIPGIWAAFRQRELGKSADGRALRAQGQVVRVESVKPRLVEIDGDVVGQTPVEISIRPGALTVIVPGA